MQMVLLLMVRSIQPLNVGSVLSLKEILGQFNIFNDGLINICVCFLYYGMKDISIIICTYVYSK